MLLHILHDTSSTNRNKTPCRYSTWHLQKSNISYASATWRQWFFVYSALSLHFDGFCNFSSVQNIDELFVQLVHNWRVYFMVITNHLASLKLVVLMHFNNQEFWDHKTWKYNCMNPIQNVSYSLKICKGHAYQHRSAHDIVINRSLFSKN